MRTPDWILIFTALFLGACALLAPYVAEIVKRKFFAPRLKILFDLAPPFCRKTTAKSQSADPVSHPIYYFRFQVLNKGKTQAKLCEAVLENLWVFSPDQTPQSYQDFSPINMGWSWSSEEFININPDRRIFADIGHISSRAYQSAQESHKFIDLPGYNGKDLRFVLDIRELFHCQPNCLPPGKYILQVGLYSENAGHVKEYFFVSWSGKWSDELDKMFKEIVIRRTQSPI